MRGGCRSPADERFASHHRPRRRPSGGLRGALITSPWRRSSPARGVPPSPGSSPGARLTDGKSLPPSAVKHLLSFFPIMSQNQAAFESFILKAFLDFSGFFFFNDEIIRSVKKLRCCGCIAARWPILPRTRWTEANSGASRRQRKPRPLRTALSPFARPPSSHPEDKGPLSPKKACVSPTPQVQVLQPPAWKLKSRFWLPKRHREPSSKLQRAKKTDFLN